MQNDSLKNSFVTNHFLLRIIKIFQVKAILIGTHDGSNMINRPYNIQTITFGTLRAIAFYILALEISDSRLICDITLI